MSSIGTLRLRAKIVPNLVFAIQFTLEIDKAVGNGKLLLLNNSTLSIGFVDYE